ncbi:hypothetical protein GCM10022393_31930 [Aquimarina addita]|uniref:Phosphoenolpyruvate synthase n=2 Tax=Aquimarina addita TaxID=870485 RepID=A0ABP6UPN9_9FLAO
MNAQEIPVSNIKKQIADYKNDIRGPYYRIKWFCKNGTIRAPKDPCPDSIGGGIQHASYKEEVIKLGKEHHIFFGEILAHTNPTEFWDQKNNHSRLKQYQIGKYLSSVDNGWILRKGQYYRGAVQSEDEETWGVDFYKWLLKTDTNLDAHYFLIRQSLRDIPHDGDNNIAQAMRSQSKIIADEFPEFMDARIKIHGKPDKTDIQLVTNFRNKYENKLSPELKKSFTKLNATLAKFYEPVDVATLQKKLNRIKTGDSLKKKVASFLKLYKDTDAVQVSVPQIATILYEIRKNITTVTDSNDRLLTLDLSNELESILLKKTQEWKPDTVKELMQKVYTLSHTAAATGLIELWEWEAVHNDLQKYSTKDELSIASLNDFLYTTRSIVEWSAAMGKANYEEIVDIYTTFEPKAYGFIDDRIRSTIALDLGETVSTLGSFIAVKSSMSNAVMNINNQSSVRGLNPGYALGTLVVVEGSPENVEVDTKNIYIFQKPPSDLKPVAGIMTVSEGNLVSHVQLLARNLGIPNAALSNENLKALLSYDGQRIFYAVSDKGNVILKPENEMTLIEVALFSKTERNKNKITVPVDEIRLDQINILNMANVNANDSGKLCGPKAANLGQLKSMFPEQVVEGLVIPFGIFRKHMDQKMPDGIKSYWEFLNDIFKEADRMRVANTPEKEIEVYQLAKLDILKEAIKKMPLEQSFITELENEFQKVFNGAIGTIPVFLRSDTNMEDLKEFTGAGLNLTLFNILSKDKIIEGIKNVWASPYTERSFKWRQQYLLNPENVFPSILIIPSVDVAYSGVMITKGINVGNEEDLTVAFSRGAGGAVDGQSAETHLISKNTSRLLSPARQSDYLRLPVTGGTSKQITTFEQPILNPKNIQNIRTLAQTIRDTLPAKTQSDYKGAYDVELGFKNDTLWLFQIRPFVENKRAKSSDYLTSITPKIDDTQKIKLTSKL